MAKIKWTEKDVKKVFKEYDKKCDVRSHPAYPAARRLDMKNPGFYEKICSHMKNVRSERESEYQKKLVDTISRFLELKDIKFELYTELYLPKGGFDVKSRVDLYLKIPSLSLEIPIEVKHDKSNWSNTHIKEQLRRYNRCVRHRVNIVKTVLVSPEGGYGFSEAQLFVIIENYIKFKKMNITFDKNKHYLDA